MAGLSLRGHLWKLANQGNVAVIFLAKNLLGYRDNRKDELLKVEHSGPDGGPIQILSDEELCAKISVLLAIPSVVKQLRKVPTQVLVHSRPSCRGTSASA